MERRGGGVGPYGVMLAAIVTVGCVGCQIVSLCMCVYDMCRACKGACRCCCCCCDIDEPESAKLHIRDDGDDSDVDADTDAAEISLAARIAECLGDVEENDDGTNLFDKPHRPS